MTMTNGNPTIVTGGNVFTSSGSATLTLYGVSNEDIRKSSGLIEFPMPVSDSNSKIMMDLMGCSREITIEGVVTIADCTKLCDYANDLIGLKDSPTASKQSLVYGGQGDTGSSQVGYKYYPELLNRSRTSNLYIGVYVMEVSVNSEKANPNSLRYSITLMECDTTNSV